MEKALERVNGILVMIVTKKTRLPTLNREFAMGHLSVAGLDLLMKRYAKSDTSTKIEWNDWCEKGKEAASNFIPLFEKDIHNVVGTYLSELELLDAIVKARDIITDLDKKTDKLIKGLIIWKAFRSHLMMKTDFIPVVIANELAQESDETLKQFHKFIACVSAISGFSSRPGIKRKIFVSSL